jgi:hypothetical protein
MAGACAAGILLTDRPLSRLGMGLPGVPKRVLFETPSAVDDLTIETDRGAVYVQAKRTISLSANAGGELASVASQFVRQFRAGMAENGSRRELQPSRDRLVLAVSDDAPATIANNLREVLDRNRTGAATALPDGLASALRIFKGLIQTAWTTEAGSPPTPDQTQALLANCSVVVIGDGQRQVTEDALRDLVVAAGDETALFDLLVGWGASASQSGTGGDAAAIRLWLSGKTRLIEPPSFRNDVARLRAYSDSIISRLERFTKIGSPEGDITITRPVVNLVIDAVPEGSLAITGEPGSGKSAVVHEVAARLGTTATIVVLTVEASAISLEALRSDLGLEHSLVDVLAQMPGDKPAYLILDALDAVRGGQAEATYRRLVELVGELDGWHVVASVRTFDLRMGREWRRVFSGTPPYPTHSDPSFTAVRHIHIGLLDGGEKGDLATKSPSIAAAIAAGGGKMEALARNPFNLALLGDLLQGGVAASTLASVATRGELLARYWDERITDLGTPATVTLASLVQLMIGARAVDIPVTAVPIPEASTVDDLQHAGVLVTEATRRIGFRHHVLFDYAVARLVLLPDRVAALPHLTRASGAGLLISPSLGYWLEELKKDTSPRDFWKFVVSLVSNDTLDAIVRIEVARLAVESVTRDEDMGHLADVLALDEPGTERALQHLAGSVLTKAHLKLPIETKPWARLVSRMTSPKAAQLGSMRGLIGTLLEASPDAEDMQALGIASRSLFDAMSTSDANIHWLASHVVPFVAKTYGTDIAESRRRLDQVLAQDRFSRLGYVEVPWLAREVTSIADHDAEFVVALFDRVFRGADFSRDQVTSMSGSWILSLTSTAAQDFNMAYHSLSTAFPDILQMAPRAALRSLAVALRGEREREHASTSALAQHSVEIAGVQRELIEDHSHIWGWKIDEDGHDDYAKLYRAALAWVVDVQDDDLLRDIPNLILGETSIAIAWRSVFDLAAARPEILGVTVWRAASTAAALSLLDTRQSAIATISATYPFIPEHDRQQAEAEWLARDFSTFSRPAERRLEILGTLFESIGETNLVTEAARSFLRDAKSDGTTFENQKPVAFRVTRSGSSAHWLEHEGVDTQAAGIAPLLALAEQVRAAVKNLKQSPTSERGATLWAATWALLQAIASAGVMGPLVDQDVSDALAEGLGLALADGYMPVDNVDVALARLLDLTNHSDPEPRQDAEENFSKFASWGAPSPRIEAAQALAILATKSEFWTRVGSRFEDMILHDHHPAVRFQLIRVLPWIGNVDADSMWRIIDAFVATEPNPTNLYALVDTLFRRARSDGARVEALALQLASQLEAKESGDDPVTGLVVFLSINQDLAGSTAAIRAWIDHYPQNEKRLHSALFDIQDTLLLGLDSDDPNERAIRGRTQSFLTSLVSAVEPAVRSWPQSGQQPTAEEVVALKLFNEIADQLYYAVGHDTLLAQLEAPQAKRNFLDEYSDLISKLATLGTPRSVHYLIDILGKLVDTDPALCFDLTSEALLRTTGVARYEHESMGADLFVKLIGRYLADYRSLFDDQTRRTKLVDCLALFVEVGWPEARRLFQSLPELLQ